jgi:hypothetical protein
MLTTSNWSNEIFKQCQDIQGCVFIPFTIGKWMFVSCILVGFLLVSCLCYCSVMSTHVSTIQLAYESRKARRIIQSRDISYAFTNVLAHDYYSLSESIHLLVFQQTSCLLGSYDHFCFFEHISNSTKLSDDFAFFVFFTFKSRFTVDFFWLQSDKT